MSKSAAMSTTTPLPGASARGQRRRAELLQALSELLEERPLADIQIDDVARLAGITRSGFYFYFPTKAAAVAALVDDLLASMLTLAVDWYERDDEDHADRVRTSMTAVVGFWREHAALITAMFDASATDAVAAEIWESFLDRLKTRSTARIERDRKLGLAPDGVPADALAAVLIDATAHAMARDVRAIRAGDGPVAHTTDALVHTWDAAVY